MSLLAVCNDGKVNWNWMDLKLVLLTSCSYSVLFPVKSENEKVERLYLITYMQLLREICALARKQDSNIRQCICTIYSFFTAVPKPLLCCGTVVTSPYLASLALRPLNGEHCKDGLLLGEMKKMLSTNNPSVNPQSLKAQNGCIIAAFSRFHLLSAVYEISAGQQQFTAAPRGLDNWTKSSPDSPHTPN